MSIQYLGIEQVPQDFRNQIKAMKNSFSSKQWNKKVIGGAMTVNVIVNFLKGEDPKGNKWKSNAARTKAGGKFSFGYYTRPSGGKVSASSLRLYDTGRFAESYGVIWASDHNVEVGPIGGEPLGKSGRKRNRLLAEVAETKWNNRIVGWGPRGIEIVNKVVERALDYIGRGKRVPYTGYTAAENLAGGKKI